MWVKLDDQAHGDPRWAKAWARCPVSIGLHALASSWAGCYLTDGHVPPEFVAGKIPDEPAREAAVEALVAAGLWAANAEGWEIVGWLDHNPSRASVEGEKAAAAERMRRSRARKKRDQGA